MLQTGLVNKNKRPPHRAAERYTIEPGYDAAGNLVVGHVRNNRGEIVETVTKGVGKIFSTIAKVGVAVVVLAILGITIACTMPDDNQQQKPKPPGFNPEPERPKSGYDLEWARINPIDANSTLPFAAGEALVLNLSVDQTRALFDAEKRKMENNLQLAKDYPSLPDMPDPILLDLIDSLNGSSIGSGGASAARNVLTELAWGHVTPEDRPLFVATMNAYLGANFNQVRLAGVKNAGNNQDYNADVDLFREKGTGDTVSLQTLLDLVNELQEPSSKNAVDCDGVGAYPIQELRDAAISLLLRNGSRAVAEGAITESGNLAQLLATVEVVIEEGKKIPGYTPQWASGGRTGILRGLDHNGRIERWVPPVTQ